MASWAVVIGFWGFSALICLPVLIGGKGALAGLVFLILLIAISTYLYSRPVAAFVQRLLGRMNII
jgi:hypothetical protein